jgi:hypothetical protein
VITPGAGTRLRLCQHRHLLLIVATVGGSNDIYNGARAPHLRYVGDFRGGDV